ncbi:MAG TPA: hypothetical protein DDY79_04890, partial [Brevundimonas sp.]|nr:hypothetical protein [Brevundimonas sp.]
MAAQSGAAGEFVDVDRRAGEARMNPQKTQRGFGQGLRENREGFAIFHRTWPSRLLAVGAQGEPIDRK